MECRNTSTKPHPVAAFTLIEIMVATAVASIAGIAILAFFIFSTKSLVAVSNYADMSLKSQIAIDKLSRELRQCTQVTAYSSNSISLLDGNGNTLQYTFSPSERTLTRTASGQSQTMLTGCSSLQFWIYQHTPISNRFECYAPAYPTNARLVSICVACSRSVTATRQSTEVAQSANVALRNH